MLPLGGSDDLPIIGKRPVLLGDGLRVVAVIRDSEARRETERALREQAQLLELAYDSVLVRRVEESAITFWNPGAVETYGFSRGETVGKVSHTLLQTVFPEDLAEMERKLAEEGRWEGELTHTRKDGSKVRFRAGRFSCTTVAMIPARYLRSIARYHRAEACHSPSERRPRGRAGHPGRT